MKQNILDVVYRKYYKEVYLYIYSLCKNHHQAETIVSDTFFKAFMSLEGRESHIKFWLLRVGKNLWLDSLKKKSELPLVDIYKDSSDGPLEQLIKNEQQRNIYHIIIQLPSQYKEILIQYYYNEFTLKEIASLYQISPGAARTLLYRARIQLKQRLLEENK